MNYKYIKLATKEDLVEHDKYLSFQLYNPKYLHLFGNSYLVDNFSTEKTDGWNNVHFNILDSDRNIIGLIKLAINRGSQIHSLNCLYVKESYLGKGFGKKAMEEFIDFCESRFTRLELTTSNRKLVTFYEQFDFKLVGTYTKRLTLTDFKVYDDHIMELVF